MIEKHIFNRLTQRKSVHKSKDADKSFAHFVDARRVSLLDLLIDGVRLAQSLPWHRYWKNGKLSWKCRKNGPRVKSISRARLTQFHVKLCTTQQNFTHAFLKRVNVSLLSTVRCSCSKALVICRFFLVIDVKMTNCCTRYSISARLKARSLQSRPGRKHVRPFNDDITVTDKNSAVHPMASIRFRLIVRVSVA